jgi:hypothetical protein
MKLNPQALEIGLLLVKDMRSDGMLDNTKPVDVSRVARLGELALEWRAYETWVPDPEQNLTDAMCGRCITVSHEFEDELETWFDND